MVVNESLSSITALMDVSTPPVLLLASSAFFSDFPAGGRIKETAHFWKMSSFTSFTVTVPDWLDANMVWSLIGLSKFWSLTLSLNG